MANPLERAVKSGIKANDMIGNLIADVGTDANPRGYVQVAYRNARRAMQSALKEADRLNAANDVMTQLRDSVLRDTRTMFANAQESGAEESAKQLRYYSIVSGEPARASVQLSSQNQSALEVVSASVDRQIASVRAMILTNSDDVEIIGDNERTGILRPGDISLPVVFWLTALVWDAFDYWTRTYSGGITFQKQAVAALDSRTTDCCLRVHGQVQPMEKPFELTGTPRYADKIDWPAFHWYCRTSGVLYLPGYDDGITTKMRSGADYFLSERAKGRSPDHDPANAF